MKLITLNTWGGRAGQQKLLDFFKKNQEVDIFCLQEIWSAPYNHLDGGLAGGVKIDHSDIMVYGKQEINNVLTDHVGLFHPHHLDNYGLFTLLNKNIDLIDSGDLFVYKERGFVPVGDVGNHARNIQFTTIGQDNKKITIINFHGLWNGRGKTDSDDRILQSKNIINFLKTLNNPFILCGDFNLLPDTESLMMFELFGLRNLIKENNITSTRTSYYKKDGKFADYIFLSEGIEVVDFKVLNDQVSDHSPLYLEFN
ncbi:MAG: hypothetical protein AB198_02640 [Parcubacteria bacterium C7867-003]|nr:MAG: hypothetical protein AB198_02640 [Parcubacteria bacterium C7867-003]